MYKGTDVELSLYTYKMQPVYCVVLVLGKEKFTIFPRMCALAMKLKSQIKSKDYVELKKKKKKNLEITQSVCRIQSDDADARVIHRKHRSVFSVFHKAFLVPVISQRLQAHIRDKLFAKGETLR